MYYYVKFHLKDWEIPNLKNLIQIKNGKPFFLKISKTVAQTAKIICNGWIILKFHRFRILCFSYIKSFSSSRRKYCKSPKTFYHFHGSSPGTSSSLFSFVVPVLQKRHLQHTIHGAANNKSGDAMSSNIPKPANIPITWVRCQITEALEWPNLFLQGPLS